MFRQPFSRSEMDRLRREMDGLFEGFLPRVYRQTARAYPAVNMWTNDKEGIVVTVELAGMAAEDINLSVTADTLTISGNRKPVDTPSSGKYHRQEQNYGEFSRAIQLPYTVNGAAVEASVNKGILRVSLPRAEAEKPKQIAVQAGS